MENNRILRANDVLELLKINRTTLWRWCKTGKVSCKKIGRTLFFDAHEIFSLTLKAA